MSLLGQPAPDFTLPSTQGDITLGSYRGQQVVVLVFYPLDFSPICSVQLPEYSAVLDEFHDLGAVVFGISRDSVYTHRAWAGQFGLEMTLIADMTLQAARAYGVAVEERGISGRAVFVIDRGGVVRLEHIEQQPGEHTLSAAAVLDTIRQLR